MAYSCYITFPTTYFAIRAESKLKESSFNYKMIPVPRVISSSCGTTLRCDCDDLGGIRDLLLQNNLELENFYRLEEVGFKTPGVEELNFDA